MMPRLRSSSQTTETTSSPTAAGVLKGQKNPESTLMMGTVMRRKSLLDITNLPSNARLERYEISGAQENVKRPSLGSEDYIPHLPKENATLMMLSGERNKIIELRDIEMQKLRLALQKSNQQNQQLALSNSQMLAKLRLALQKSNQQNQQLARANSQMLAEHNQDKDKLKILNHDIGCISANLSAKCLELEEKNKLIKQLREMIDVEKITEVTTNLDNVAGEAPPANLKKAGIPNRKRALRSQSLGSAMVVPQATARDEKRRRSLRRSINVQIEPTDGLFEIEDAKVTTNPSASDPVHNHGSNPGGSSVPSITVKEEDESPSRSEQDQYQGVRRMSFGRPSRRAAEGVCYKEPPLNVKMRRDF